MLMKQILEEFQEISFKFIIILLESMFTNQRLVAKVGVELK